MQSVYKLPIGMAVVDLADHGELKLDQPVRVEHHELVPAALHSPIRDLHPNGNFDMTARELLRYAISESDGTASDVLLRLAGGPGRVMEYLRRIGAGNIAVADTEAAISRAHDVQYRNWATPDGAVELLEKVSQPLILTFMTETRTGLRRLKGMLPPGTVVAHKTGTSGTRNGVTAATNDIGLIFLPDGRRLAIAVFVSDSRAPEAVREGVIARIAKAVYDCELVSFAP